MFPNHYFGLFPPFPRNNRVFVAMSFDEQFKDRWQNVLVPAITSVPTIIRIKSIDYRFRDSINCSRCRKTA